MKLWLCLPLLLCGCAAGYDSSPVTPLVRDDSARSDDEDGDSDAREQGGIAIVDASAPDAASTRSAGGSSARSSGGSSGAASGASSGSRGGAGGRRSSVAGAGGSAAVGGRGGSLSTPDAGVDSGAAEDAATATNPITERNSGSCCSASNLPGCGDSAVQACVCERLPQCCSVAWDDSCTRLVYEKHCQSGVRDCVCGNGEGQWQQDYCCQGGWNNTCDSVAINKCGASAECR
jgi:hypothetical protein